jgi:hypothetical protein
MREAPPAPGALAASTSRGTAPILRAPPPVIATPSPGAGDRDAANGSACAAPVAVSPHRTAPPPDDQRPRVLHRAAPPRAGERGRAGHRRQRQRAPRPRDRAEPRFTVDVDVRRSAAERRRHVPDPRLDYDDAQFSFYGWSKEINKRTFQVIDVRKGSNDNISIAVVRKIISIIREYEPGDFRWHSLRPVARPHAVGAPEDNAELEKFMMQEFFTDGGAGAMMVPGPDSSSITLPEPPSAQIDTIARLPAGRAASSFTAWLRMRAPVAPNGWPSAMLPAVGIDAVARKRPVRCLDADLVAQERLALERAHVRCDLRRERLVDLPQVEVFVASSRYAHEQARNAVSGRHQQALGAQVDRAHFPIDEAHARHALRQLGQARRRRDPQRGGAVGERRGIAGREGALAARAVERGGSFASLSADVSRAAACRA